MKKIKSTLLKLWKDESGQGTAEYVLILVAIVGLAIVFRGKIQDMMKSRLSGLATQIGNFGSTGE